MGVVSLGGDVVLKPTSNLYFGAPEICWGDGQFSWFLAEVCEKGLGSSARRD